MFVCILLCVCVCVGGGWGASLCVYQHYRSIGTCICVLFTFGIGPGSQSEPCIFAGGGRVVHSGSRRQRPPLDLERRGFPRTIKKDGVTVFTTATDVVIVVVS